jgi:hypothetical protein
MGRFIISLARLGVVKKIAEKAKEEAK